MLRETQSAGNDSVCARLLQERSFEEIVTNAPADSEEIDVPKHNRPENENIVTMPMLMNSRKAAS